MTKGAKLAMIFFLTFQGECGPFGGEDPGYIRKDNKVGLHSQCGISWYTFNDDGSIDLSWDYIAEQELISEGYENPYTDIQTHFDSIYELINSEDGWVYDFYIKVKRTVGDLIKDIMGDEE